MPDKTRFERHERLMTGLADAQGVDFDLAMLCGEVTPEQYTEAVLACTGCSAPETCERHVRARRSVIPTFCRNGDLIARLAGTVSVPE